MRRPIASALAAMVLWSAGCGGVAPDIPAPSPPPAVGQPVVLDASVPGWTTSAWLARESFCVRVARSDGKLRKGRENQLIFCGPVPPGLDVVGSPLIPAKPVPYVAPQDPRRQKTILVGTVRGAITEVSVTLYGTTATGVVRPLPATAGRQVGAYVVWLPSSGPNNSGLSTSDITALIGRDSRGVTVASG